MSGIVPPDQNLLDQMAAQQAQRDAAQFLPNAGQLIEPPVNSIVSIPDDFNTSEYMVPSLVKQGDWRYVTDATQRADMPARHQLARF